MECGRWVFKGVVGGSPTRIGSACPGSPQVEAEDAILDAKKLIAPNFVHLRVPVTSPQGWKISAENM